MARIAKKNFLVFNISDPKKTKGLQKQALGEKRVSTLSPL